MVLGLTIGPKLVIYLYTVTYGYLSSHKLTDVLETMIGLTANIQAYIG